MLATVQRNEPGGKKRGTKKKKIVGTQRGRKKLKTNYKEGVKC